ncbi:hypothetical protein [Sphingobium olei]|uniref:hypothetical protein n=1 Tax=Sphingobium olei TaxID=420955 RepID=UPI003D1A6486
MTLAASPEQNTAAKPKEATPETKIIKRTQPLAVSIAAPVLMTQPAIMPPPCGPGQYESKDDLCAQWKAADAASSSASWSWWQMLIAGGGLLVGIVTMGAAIAAAFFAKQAANETKKSASAASEAVTEAREANKIAQQTGEAQVRCYLSIQNVQVSLSRESETSSITTFEPNDPNKKDSIYPNIFFKVRNHGNSPAMGVSFNFSIKFMSHFLKDGSHYMQERQSERRFPRDVDDTEDWGEIIPASGELSYDTTLMFSLSEFEHRALNTLDAGLSISLVISIIFSDVFNHKFSEDYCFLGGWKGLSGTSTERGRIDFQAMPIECFETQEELQRRHEERQSN